MRRFGLLLAGFSVALAFVGCAGGDGGAVTTTASEATTQARWVRTIIPQAFDAAAINDRGQVVGTGRFSASARGYLWQQGQRTDLGSLGGGWANAHDINERGQIVGASDLKPGPGDYGVGDRHAFLWQRGTMSDLGTLGTSDYSRARAINERGDVIGETGDGYFLWRKGKMIQLPLRPTAINDRGQIVGALGAGASDRQGHQARHAFLWDDGTTRDLCVIAPTRNCEAVAINNRTQVLIWGWKGERCPYGAGGCVDREDWERYGNRAFLWQSGRLTDLGTLGGAQSWPNAINNRGQISGVSRTRSGTPHVFLWQTGRMRDVGATDEWWATTVISERGQVVSTDALGRPYVWQNGRSTPLPNAAIANPARSTTAIRSPETVVLAPSSGR